MRSITFNGGRVLASDTTFRLFGGLLQADLQGIQGTPTTIAPPGSVDQRSFDSSEHLFTLNRGSLEAAGQAINLTESPVSTEGEGLGMIELTQAGPIENGRVAYDVTLSLPLLIDDTFVLEDVPLIGSFSIDLLASGTVVATDRIQLPVISNDAHLQAGDANQDLSFDQQDIVRRVKGGQVSIWNAGDVG